MKNNVIRSLNLDLPRSIFISQRLSESIGLFLYNIFVDEDITA